MTVQAESRLTIPFQQPLVAIWIIVRLMAALTAIDLGRGANIIRQVLPGYMPGVVARAIPLGIRITVFITQLPTIFIVTFKAKGRAISSGIRKPHPQKFGVGISVWIMAAGTLQFTIAIKADFAG